MKTPDISVCIPVYETEEYLEQCLRSVILQDFDSFEIVIVSDASRGCDSRGRNAKKIVRAMEKEGRELRKKAGLSKIEINFIEHRENRGILEVRRTLCYEARGLYIIQCDSDDEMAPGTLTALWEAGQGFDIVHGSSTAGSFDEKGNFAPAAKNLYGKIVYEEISGHDIFSRWLLKGEFTANVWGKLIKRELYLKAWESIPYTECNLGDDLLIFFFIAQYAASYKGIEKQVYRYRINAGMTGHRKIDTLDKWEKVCSAASIFTILSEWIKNNPQLISEEETDKVREKALNYLTGNLKQLRETVVPELLPQARKMLGDFWGENFVEKLEKTTPV